MIPKEGKPSEGDTIAQQSYCQRVPCVQFLFIYEICIPPLAMRFLQIQNNVTD